MRKIVCLFFKSCQKTLRVFPKHKQKSVKAAGSCHAVMYDMNALSPVKLIKRELKKDCIKSALALMSSFVADWAQNTS